MSLSEALRRALASGGLHAARDAEATTPEERFVRGFARAQLGMDAEARLDFEAARESYPEDVAVEVALLDFRAQRPQAEVLAALDAVLARIEDGNPLEARAQHVRGRVLARRATTGEAVGALRRALELYTDGGETAKQAEVLDTLGMVYAFDGRLEVAAAYYALAIARKSIGGDRAGVALTLGNLGRLQMRSGRYREALECFTLDLEIARELGDGRGIARMLNDVGRARLGSKDAEGAIASLEECVRAAQSSGHQEIAPFAYKDLALALLARDAEQPGDPLHRSRAQAAVAEGLRLLEGRDDPFAEALLAHADGLVRAACGSEGAEERLATACRALDRLETPDFEIPALLDLARLLVEEDRKGAAHESLARALHLAQRDGHARYLAPIQEELARLDLPDAASIEEGQLDLDPERRPVGGNYTPLKRLGGGKFGDVYLALDGNRNREVALKMLRLDDLYDANERRGYYASIRVELEAASRIRHPGIARVHAIGTDSAGGTYVVQDYVAGHALSEVMPDDGSAQLESVLEAVRDVADALQALHDAGVVHRDLKPANVMLRANGRPVLIDMGVAFLPSNPEILGRDTLVGTLAYMAPEQATSKGIDGRADVYALGVVLFEWLTGLRPLHLPGSGVGEIVRRIRKEAPMPLDELRPGLPTALGRLVREMLAKSPRARPIAHEVARRLDTILADLRREQG